MIGSFLQRLPFLRKSAPTLSEANVRDVPAIAKLHAASFRRGWSEDEIERMLLDRNVLAHCARLGRRTVGFILSRRAADEAEILSVATAARMQGRGIGRALLDLHLRRLAGFGIAAVFLEVDENNAPARRLYARAGFREVAKRPSYYAREDAAPAAAVVLRRDLA
jgi:[ribosomal protein S18]-alanine N-acetyltransferase